MKDKLKTLVADLPLAADLYWWLRTDHKAGRYEFRYPLEVIVQSVEAANRARKSVEGKSLFIFATLDYWIEHISLLGIALAGQGHRVTLAYLPYENWTDPISNFDLRRQDLYTRDMLKPADGLLKIVPLHAIQPVSSLPDPITNAIEEVSLFDSQYTLQAEDVDPNHPLRNLRRERNRSAAGSALAYLRKHRPDVVIVPNGTIQEFGIIYAVSRHLDIPTVTYEFGEQADRAWLAQDAQIIKHQTDNLWEARKGITLTEDHRQWLRAFFAARGTVQRGEHFARLWQNIATLGGQKVRSQLGLDSRPVVLFTTNVLGDSLTLGRQLLGSSMSEWITKLVQFFASRTDVQLVIRIHPGENLTMGPSVTGVIQNALLELPGHIHLISPQDKVNTYDLMEIAGLGLVYTTTSGLEMATRGIPVMTAGRTHYRGRGFTIDTATYDEYFSKLDAVLSDLVAYQLTPEQVELAWNYAYRFFKEFPLPFPWHILHVAEDVSKKPMAHALSDEGLNLYGETFRYLAGDPLDWSNIQPVG
ncbi:MAG: hypothetical protein ABIJ39_14650 [Chloroflexota bacterium]